MHIKDHYPGMHIDTSSSGGISNACTGGLVMMATHQVEMVAGVCLLFVLVFVVVVDCSLTPTSSLDYAAGLSGPVPGQVCGGCMGGKPAPATPLLESDTGVLNRVSLFTCCGTILLENDTGVLNRVSLFT